jgi:hypothetical protein
MDIFYLLEGLVVTLTFYCEILIYQILAERVEQDILDFLDLVYFDVLISILVTEILIRNVFILFRFSRSIFL